MHPSLMRAIVGGFVGTLAITAMMYWVVPVMTGAPMDIAAMLSSLVNTTWAAGMAWHFLNGTIIFPALYVYLVYALLAGSPTVRGMTWGLTLWLLAQAVVMPMMGGGFFSSNAGGAMAVLGSFIGHAIYGALLGAIAGPALSYAAHREAPHAA